MTKRIISSIFAFLLVLSAIMISLVAITSLITCRAEARNVATYVNAAAFNIFDTPFVSFSCIKPHFFSSSFALFEASNSTGRVINWNNNDMQSSNIAKSINPPNSRINPSTSITDEALDAKLTTGTNFDLNTIG